MKPQLLNIRRKVRANSNKTVKFQLFKLGIDYKTIPYNTRLQILGYEN